LYLQTGYARVVESNREVTAQHKHGHLFPIDIAISRVKSEDSLVFIARANAPRPCKQQCGNWNPLAIPSPTTCARRCAPWVGSTVFCSKTTPASLDTQGRRHLERIRVAVQRMGALIDELLGLSRVERGRQVSRPYHRTGIFFAAGDASLLDT
jgi:signal transduction histidine kinase